MFAQNGDNFLFIINKKSEDNCHALKDQIRLGKSALFFANFILN